MKRIYVLGFFVIVTGTPACNKESSMDNMDMREHPSGAPAAAPQSSMGRPIAIAVDATGYHPDVVHATAGQSARLVFTRTSDEGCGQQLVFPALGIRRDLPLNEAVSVDVTMPETGSITFTCGMDMLRGSVVAH